jgi:hypothetical protein
MSRVVFYEPGAHLGLSALSLLAWVTRSRLTFTDYDTNRNRAEKRLLTF